MSTLVCQKAPKLFVMADKEEPNFEALENELGLSPMDQDAVQMHELFRSLLKAGFRERQALILVAMIVNEAQEDAVIFTSTSEEDWDEDDEEIE